MSQLIRSITIAATATCLLVSALLFKRYAFAQVSLSDALVIGISDDYPPYTFRQNDLLAGFDIDLMDALGKTLGLPVIYKNMSFDVLLLELQRGSLHAIVGGLTVTPERAKRVLFTAPYTDSDSLVLVHLATTAITPETTAGAKLVVIEGYTADQFASCLPQTILERVDSLAQAILILKQGKADGLISSHSAFTPVINQGIGKQFVVETIPGTEEQCAIAVSKKYPELFKQLNSALEELGNRGTLATLKKKWGIHND